MSDWRVDETDAIRHLERIGPATRQALRDALAPLASKIASDAQSRAQAHIHTIGKFAGEYVDSIYGGVKEDDNGVVGYVRSGYWLASFLEYGAETPAHLIGPNAAQALAFDGSAGKVFAKLVHSPGAVMPAFPAITAAFAAASDEIARTIDEAVKQSAGAA